MKAFILYFYVSYRNCFFVACIECIIRVNRATLSVFRYVGGIEDVDIMAL